MRSSLILQGLMWKAIEEKFSNDSKESENQDLKERSLSVIFISVTDNALCKITGEKMITAAWKKLEDYTRQNH